MQMASQLHTAMEQVHPKIRPMVSPMDETRHEEECMNVFFATKIPIMMIKGWHWDSNLEVKLTYFSGTIKFINIKNKGEGAIFKEHRKTHLVRLGPSPIDTGTPDGPLMLRNCFFDFAVEHWFGCRTNERSFDGDISAINIRLSDWLGIACPEMIWRSGVAQRGTNQRTWNWPVLKSKMWDQPWRTDSRPAYILQQPPVTYALKPIKCLPSNP